MRKALSTIALPTSQLMTVPLADGFVARVKLTVPYGADLSGDTKYPLLALSLIHIYSLSPSMGPTNVNNVTRLMVEKKLITTDNSCFDADCHERPINTFNTF